MKLSATSCFRSIRTLCEQECRVARSRVFSGIKFKRVFRDKISGTKFKIYYLKSIPAFFTEYLKFYPYFIRGLFWDKFKINILNLSEYGRQTGSCLEGEDAEEEAA